MKPQERYEWIVDYVNADRLRATGGVDILDSDFVDAYIDATNAKYRLTNYGAYKCAQLGADLSAMHDKGMLRRSRIGVSGFAGMGFPRWVFSYHM